MRMAAGPVSRVYDAAEFELRDALTDYSEAWLTLERTSILHEAAQRLRELTDGGLSLVGLAEPDGPMVLRHWSGTRTSGLHGLVVPRGLGLGGKALADGRPRWVANYVRSGAITHDFDGPVASEELETMLAVPMGGFGAVPTFGVVYTALRQSRHIGDRYVRAVESIARNTALGVQLSDRAAAKAKVEVESVRTDLAYDLHDTIGALLFRIGAEVRDLSSEQHVPPAFSDRLQGLEQRVSEAAAMLRECLSGLRETPAEFALSTVVRADCRAFEQRTGVRCQLALLDELPAMDTMRNELALRIVREGLLNIEKHARASSVVVGVGQSRGGVLIAVADDGVGVRPGSADDGPRAIGSQIGIEGLRHALAQVGGTIDLLANPDGGATLRAWMPWWAG